MCSFVDVSLWCVCVCEYMFACVCASCSGCAISGHCLGSVDVCVCAYVGLCVSRHSGISWMSHSHHTLITLSSHPHHTLITLSPHSHHTLITLPITHVSITFCSPLHPSRDFRFSFVKPLNHADYNAPS